MHIIALKWNGMTKQRDICSWSKCIRYVRTLKHSRSDCKLVCFGCKCWAQVVTKILKPCIIPLMFFVFPFTTTSIYMQTFNVLLIVFFFVEGGLDVGSFAVKLAHVNCFDWTDVCQKNNVTVYPTVKMFRWVLNHCKLGQYFIYPFILKTRSGLTWISGERV